MKRIVFEGIGLGLSAAVAITGCAKPEPVRPDYSNEVVRDNSFTSGGEDYSFEAGLYMGCNADNLWPRDPGEYIDELETGFAERGVPLDRDRVWSGYYLGVEDPTACR